MYRKFTKPWVDRILAAFLIGLLTPLIILLSIALAWINRGEIFFRQPRPGLNGRIFLILKFKTMNDKRDINGQLLSDEQRITPVGRFIRKLSLDEIPQLINVLRGEMSFIGPRPLLVDYLPKYNSMQARRHEIRPGITGWAQVNGRNAISWEQKFTLDVWYVDHESFLLDLKIVFLTIIQVVRSEGINSATSATMEPFNGNK